MKKIESYFAIIIVFFLWSCEKVVDKPLLDEISEDTYWRSVSDLELFVNQFYQTFRTSTAYNNPDNNSDNAQPMAPNDALAGTRSIPGSGGGWDWGDIRAVNSLIQHTDDVEEGAASDIDQYKGEGLFFRAYFYFNLLKRFGDLPWYDKVLTTESEELYDPRQPRNIIVDHILEDLDGALTLLHDKNQVDQGRITRGAALLLKSRVGLYEGTWEKYHEGDVFGVPNSDFERYLRAGLDAAEKLIEEGSYELYSTGDVENDYYELFSQDDLSENPEVILYETMDPNLGLSDWHWAYLNGTGGGATGLSKDLIDSYLCDDGLPIGISTRYKGDSTIKQVVTNRDLRMGQTFWVPGQIRLNGDPVSIFKNPTLNVGGEFGTSTGYMWKKGSTTDPNQNKGSSTDKNSLLDRIAFRYAEGLLNFAELKAELNELTQQDLDISINILRDRVGLPHLDIDVGFVDPNWKFPDLNPILNEIRRERRIELASEGFRYDDIMRWAAADILIKGKRLRGAKFIPGVSFPDIEDQISDIRVDQDRYIDRYQKALPNGFQFDLDRDYLFPLPVNQLSLNDNLEQNPGW